MLRADRAGTMDNVPIIELLTELDRRAKAEQPPTVHFYGVWPGHGAGHTLRDSFGRDVRRNPAPTRKAHLYPWEDHRLPQAEGKVWHWHHLSEPLTLLLSWDRSADERRNCCATFVIHAHVTAARGLTLARNLFPAVLERIERHLGCPVELAGPSLEEAPGDGKQ